MLFTIRSNFCASWIYVICWTPHKSLRAVATSTSRKGVNHYFLNRNRLRNMDTFQASVSLPFLQTYVWCNSPVCNQTLNTLLWRKYTCIFLFVGRMSPTRVPGFRFLQSLSLYILIILEISLRIRTLIRNMPLLNSFF